MDIRLDLEIHPKLIRKSHQEEYKTQNKFVVETLIIQAEIEHVRSGGAFMKSRSTPFILLVIFLQTRFYRECRKRLLVVGTIK
jgi:hypothetical protein